MQSTKALASLKNLFVQPLPLNKRDSEKLLKAITTSFRAQLDREHGWQPPEFPQNDLIAPPISYLPSSSTNTLASSHTVNQPHRPVDRHMQALLENPLFKRNGASQLVGVSRMERERIPDPRTIFEAGVARGIMTIPRAHGFLLKSKEAITQSAALSVRKAMGEYGAGLLVLNWLRASGQERELAFLQHRAFTTLLLEFMVAERVDDLAWVWLERLSAPEARGRAGPPAFWLLEVLVRSKYTNVVELESAYKLILRGHALFEKNGLRRSNIRHAWRSLARETTGRSWRHTLPETDIYDAFLQLPGQFPTLALFHAHLELHHPARPSPERAVEYLLSREPGPSFQATLGIAQFREMITSLALDTCHYLTNNDEIKLARDIFDKVADLGLSRFFGHDYLLAENDTILAT